jgi:hypothetical protein
MTLVDHGGETRVEQLNLMGQILEASHALPDGLRQLERGRRHNVVLFRNISPAALTGGGGGGAMS